jgi:hypothetical protein
MENDYLSLSTEVIEPVPFTIDDVEYQMYTIDHLDEEQEAAFGVLFRRFERNRIELNRTKNDTRANKLMHTIRDQRADIICALTSVPKEIALKLPASQQTKLLNSITRKLQAQVRDAEEDLDAEEDDD